MDELSSAPQAAPGAGAVPAVPPDFVPLRLVLDPGGAMLELTRVDVLIGRHSDADVRLPLPDVSRRHCRFLWLDGRWQVLDLHSLNGVFVNDEPVQQATLQAGDRVRIGGFTFRVELAAAVPETREGVLRDLLRSLPAPGNPTPHRRAS
jgi:pSer/pThr/pTyr-binding forkhead associated (FHA) protein